VKAPGLTAATVNDDDALALAVNELLLGSKVSGKLSKRVRRGQDRLERVVDRRRGSSTWGSKRSSTTEPLGRRTCSSDGPSSRANVTALLLGFSSSRVQKDLGNDAPTPTTTMAAPRSDLRGPRLRPRACLDAMALVPQDREVLRLEGAHLLDLDVHAKKDRIA
jgi:hypothetical protein